MLGSAIKISLRTLYREKRYALINISGLALALACSIVLGLYLKSEMTYDRHYEGYENIYRIANEFTTAAGTTDAFAVTSPALGPLMASDYQEIDEVVRFRPANQSNVFFYEDQSYYWENCHFASPNVFEVFKQEIIYGDPETALDEPYTLAISESMSRAYFGDANPIGEILTGDNGRPWTITLVFADQPHNTHFKYDALYTDNIPLTTLPESVAMQERMLFNVGMYTYLKMHEGFDPANWPQMSQDFFDRHMSQTATQVGFGWTSWLQPLKDIHLHSDVPYDYPTGSLYYNYAFIAVALFIVLIACINYMNLSTARSAKRAREVGMRKILGTPRSALVTQFLSESLLYALIALVFAIVMVELVLTLTPINSLLGNPLALSMTEEPGLILVALGLCLGIGLLAGLYPAFYLSSWQPLTALVGNKKSNTGNIRFRSALVFMQFCITVTVIACTLLMAAQMRFISDKELGFNKENKVVINLRGADVIEQIPVIQNELLTHPNVLGVTASNSLLGETLGVNALDMETETGESELVTVGNMSVMSNYVEVMGMNLLQGRSFSTRLLTDIGTNFVVNQALVDSMGWTEPLGKRIQDGRVIGVVEDFNYASLHTEIEPFVMVTYPDNEFEGVDEDNRIFSSRNLIVNISGDGIRSTLNFLEETILNFDAEHPFVFRFFDDSLNELYQSEERLMKLIGIFSAICIFIACLGLYGLAAFTTEQRTQEIGIRKVLGATSGQIITLLARNILGLVLGGAALAAVISYLAINEWLSGFAYRAMINPIYILIAAGVAMLVAYLTVAVQSFTTAQSDPALSLRHE